MIETTAIKISKCRTEKILLECPICHKWYAVQSVCHDRLCEYCGRVRSMIWFHKLKNIELRWPLFITLTLIPDNDLSFLISFMHENFVKLRRKFKQLKRGVYSIEINYSSSEDGKWYVHLHMLVDCSWIKGEDLGKAWSELTGAYIKKIKRVNSQRAGILEVCKYTTKGNGTIKGEDLNYVGECIRHRRLINTWNLGSLLDTEEITPQGLECPKCHVQLKYKEKVDMFGYLEGKRLGLVEDYLFDTS